jgi:hypothetical protein
VTVRLNGSLTAQVLSDGAGWTLVLRTTSARHGPCATSAAPSAPWHAFGRYDRVLLDLSAFSCASPDLHAVLTGDVRKAAAAPRLRPLGALDGPAHGTGVPT